MSVRGMEQSRSTRVHLRDPHGITKGPACGSRSEQVTTVRDEVTCRTCRAWIEQGTFKPRRRRA